MTAVATSPAPRTDTDQRLRQDVQVGLVFVAICLTSVATLAVSLLFPAVGEDGWFSYSSVLPYGAFFWAFLTLAAVNIVVGVFAGTIATLLLVPARGWRWATAGAVFAIVGSGFYAVGVGGWAMLYYFAANSSALDPAAASDFFESVNADGLRVFLSAAGGAVMISLAVLLMAIGLWRSGNVPKMAANRWGARLAHHLRPSDRRPPGRLRRGTPGNHERHHRLVRLEIPARNTYGRRCATHAHAQRQSGRRNRDLESLPPQ